MRVFKEPNLSNGWVCPICYTNEKKPVVLIPVEGTEEGNNIQAEQFHLDCIGLVWEKRLGIIYQKV